MKKAPALLVMMLMLFGCMATTKKYYQIRIPDKTPPGFGTLPGVVLVEPPEVEDFYDDYRIVYRVSPYEFNYYAYRFWAKRPGRLLRDAVRDYLIGNRVFRSVVFNTSEGEPNLVIKARLHAVEEYDRKQAWYGRLAMSIRIVDYKSGNTVVTHDFDREAVLPGNKVEGLPAVISSILAEEMGKLWEKAVEKIG